MHDPDGCHHWHMEVHHAECISDFLHFSLLLFHRYHCYPRIQSFPVPFLAGCHASGTQSAADSVSYHNLLFPLYYSPQNSIINLCLKTRKIDFPPYSAAASVAAVVSIISFSFTFNLVSSFSAIAFFSASAIASGSCSACLIYSATCSVAIPASS